MPLLRNRLSATLAGGPRQFAEIRDTFIIKAGNDDTTETVTSELTDLGFDVTELENAPILTAEPEDRIGEVIASVGDVDAEISEGLDKVREARDEDNILDVASQTIEATQSVLDAILEIDDVDVAEFVRTEADFGPANLRLDVQDRDNLSERQARSKEANIETVYENEGLSEAHKITRGENAISCIFDTAFPEDLIAEERIVDTFHGDMVDTVYNSSEGHGGMCAGAMAANAMEEVPFDGIAPESRVILVRITDDEGQIRGDIITEAWDWLTSLELDRPLVSNHSYGSPICSGRPKQKFCGTPINDIISIATSEPGISAVYACGNEASRCGRRPSGLTNAITGTNSISDVFTVGALLSNGREAQRYSSHGRGDCAPIADPKPNVSFPIPKTTYYGGRDGWKLKDLSTGPFGSGGGTSHASPSVAGIITLMQSKAVEERGEPMEDEEIKRILHETAEMPHRNQINSFSFFFSRAGYDSRFGHGKADIVEALEEV